MRALDTPLAPAGGPLLAGTPVRVLSAGAVTLAVAAALHAEGLLPRAALGAAAIAVCHGGLLATALAWTATDVRRAPSPWTSVVLLGVAAGAGAAWPPAAIAYAVVPLWLWRLARRGASTVFGAAPGAAWLLVGVIVGGLLGAHLHVTASLTLGYRLRARDVGELWPWLAFDVGAQVPATEAFFRGALFDRLHRRRSFALAAAVATAASIARYLVDPLFPWSMEVVAGAFVYFTLLGVANCWLFARTGSALPGLAGALTFISSWRLLAVGR